VRRRDRDCFSGVGNDKVRGRKKRKRPCAKPDKGGKPREKKSMLKVSAL